MAMIINNLVLLELVCNLEFACPTLTTSLNFLNLLLNVWSFIDDQGTEKIEGICLDMSKVKEICLNPDTFTKMCRLRFLKFYSSINGQNKCQVSDFRALRFAEVRYLHWHGYPFKSLPSNIHPEKLVILEMPHSNIEQLSESVQVDIS